MTVIDLFAGCGGLSLGFIKAGFNIYAAVEFDAVIAKTYMKNHPDIKMFVDDIKNVDIAGTFRDGDADVIIGGPPCQGFSMAGARIRKGFTDDPRNYLFQHFNNIVKTVHPKVFVFENVKGMLTMNGGAIFDEINMILSAPSATKKQSYYVFSRLVSATEFGIPQKRERLVLIGTRMKNLDIDYLWNKTKDEIIEENPSFFDVVTIHDAISNLPSVSKDGCIKNPVPVTPYQYYLRSENEEIHNHTQSQHSKLAIDRMNRIGNGKNYNSLNETINSIHSGSYGRLCWGEQASTITTRFDTPAGGRFIHPDENRTLTPREAARIQSFPDSYVFYGDKRSISRQIGNAVPPKVSYFLARLTKNIISSDN